MGGVDWEREGRRWGRVKLEPEEWKPVRVLPFSKLVEQKERTDQRSGGVKETT